MNNTVQTIIDMDKAARQRKKEAEQKAAEILREAEEKRLSLIKASDAKTEAEASRICMEIKLKSDEEIEKVKTQTEEKCRRLDEILDGSAQKLMDEIIGRIFGGTAENE